MPVVVERHEAVIDALEHGFETLRCRLGVGQQHPLAPGRLLAEPVHLQVGAHARQQLAAPNG